MKKKESKSDVIGGLFIIGCLMLGIGFGIYSGNAAVGTLVGLGVGFILFALTKILMKK